MSNAKFKIIATDDDAIQKYVKTTWSNGEVTDYPYIWLRDNCQCEKCYQVDCRSRILDMVQLNFDVAPDTIKIEDSQITITWSDKHVGQYSLETLWDCRFTEDGIKERAGFDAPEQILWGGEFMKKNLPVFDYNEVLENDVTLREWLHSMELYGIALLKNAKKDEGELEKLTRRVSFARITSYGEVFYTQVKPNASYSHVGYTSKTFPLHADYGYSREPPTVLILHCIQQTPVKGGESGFADAKRACQIFKQRFPQEFQLLSTLPCDFRDVGSDAFGSYYKIGSFPLITLDRNGDLEHLRISLHTRDEHLRLPKEQVEPWYRAFVTFYKFLHEPENKFDIKLDEGDIVSLQNSRVLHMRNSFISHAGSGRKIAGTYMDFDEISSRRRVLDLAADKT